MASRNLKFCALIDTLEDLRPSDLTRFCFKLQHREEPRVRTRDLMGRDPAEITLLLVSAYTEDGALSVAVEILKEIGCHVEAERLSVMKAGGKYFIPDPRGKERFVDKYKDHLIYNVSNVGPILDELLTKQVIQQESYDRIRALPTLREKMRELLDCLGTVGVEGKVIFYDIIEKLQPHLLEDIRMPPVVKGIDVRRSRLTDLDYITEKLRKKMVTRSQMSPEDDWIKLQPEVNSVDTPTYSLQSEAGNFECSVSGLRWVCKEKVSFKYQFGSWEEHMERLETMQYIPGGPQLDITVIAGKLDEVYLPHWICTKDNPTIIGKFAVLPVEMLWNKRLKSRHPMSSCPSQISLQEES